MLGFKNFKFLTAKKVEVHQRAKFRRNRLNCGRDMVIFRFFKMALSYNNNNIHICIAPYGRNFGGADMAVSPYFVLFY